MSTTNKISVMNNKDKSASVGTVGGKRADSRKKWDKPVSKAFYGQLEEKALVVIQEMSCSKSILSCVMGYIDNYMARKEEPHWSEVQWLRAFFYTVKPDVDKAMLRRERAIQAAARRRARKQAETEAVDEEKKQPQTPQASATESISKYFPEKWLRSCLKFKQFLRPMAGKLVELGPRISNGRIGTGIKSLRLLSP